MFPKGAVSGGKSHCNAAGQPGGKWVHNNPGRGSKKDRSPLEFAAFGVLKAMSLTFWRLAMPRETQGQDSPKRGQGDAQGPELGSRVAFRLKVRRGLWKCDFFAQKRKPFTLKPLLLQGAPTPKIGQNCSISDEFSLIGIATKKIKSCLFSSLFNPLTQPCPWDPGPGQPKTGSKGQPVAKTQVQKFGWAILRKPGA